MRIPPALAPALLATALSAVFVFGVPGGAFWADGAFRTGGPTLEIVGHYLPETQYRKLGDVAEDPDPDAPDGEDATREHPGVGPSVIVGSGPLADVRLTEPDVPEDLARVGLGHYRVHWLHDSTERSAAFYRLQDGWLPSVEPLPDALPAVEDGDRVVTSEKPLTVDEATSACAGKDAVPVHLVDATGLWLDDDRGRPRTDEVPAVRGASKPFGDGALYYDGTSLWIAKDDVCKDAPCWDADVAKDGFRVGSGAFDLAFARAIDLPAVVPGDGTPSLALMGSRFVKPDAYVVLGDAPPALVGVTGEAGPLRDDFTVFRRKPLAESSFPWVWKAARLVSDDEDHAPRIGRTPGYPGDVWLCRDGQGPEEVGHADLGPGDVLVAGHSDYAVSWTAGHAVDLALTEPPAHRVHALASLSFGDLRADDDPIPVPACTVDGKPRSLLLRGETGEEVLPADVVPADVALAPRPDQEVATIPLPAWAARQHPRVQGRGELDVDLLDVCVDGDGALRVLDDRSPPGLPLTELPGTRISPGSTFGVAGHLVKYTTSRPILEQTLPIAGFVPPVALMGLVSVRRLVRAAGPRGGLLERHGAALATAVVVALLVIGALLQVRMAASPDLLGSADYLHRHLLTGFLAAAVLMTASDTALHPDALARVLVRNARLATTLLACWLWADRLAWAVYRWAGPANGALWGSGTTSAGPAVAGDVDRALIAVTVLAVACWAVPVLVAPLKLGAKLASRLPRRFTDRPADDETTTSLPPRGARGFLWAALTSPGPEARPLLIGVAVLFVGVVFGSGRALMGFDLKPAEFAAVPIGLGLARLLVGWSRTGSSWGRFAVPASTLLWLALVTAAVVGGYALRGDLGPLMVLVPAMFGTVVWWALPWTSHLGGRADDEARGARAAVVGGYAGLIGLGFATVWAIVPALQSRLVEVPAIGSHVQRAVDRFETYFRPWYTETGHWSTTANWIAAGYFEGREHYVSNLHSDLAFVALMQSFSTPRALLVLAAFLGLVSIAGAFGEAALVRSENAWKRALAAVQSRRDDREERRRYAREDVPAFLDAGVTGYFCVFVALYLGAEVAVHVGTCFDTLPQTGLTLPWISSGGSASVGFAMLLGVALARFARTSAKLGDIESRKASR